LSVFRLRHLCASLLLAAISTTVHANDTAYVLLYHHVAHGKPESTSVTPDQFAVHMEYIADNGYRVLPLEKILTALEKGRDLPDRSLAITFDDAYPSVLENAVPILENHKWPFTVFASTADIDRATTKFMDAGTVAYMTWDQLRELEKKRGTIANHGNVHQHMLAREPNETDAQWRERISGDIKYAQSRLEAELKRPAKLLSYPYGEFDAQLVALVQDLGYLAVGQQSGPIGATSNPYAAPRFPLSFKLADLPSVSEKLNTRPFDITSPEVPATLLPLTEDKPTLDLHLKPGPFRAGQLTCFVAGQGTAKVRWQDSASTFAKITSRQDLPVGRTNYTCTAPHESIPSLYYWYTHVYMKREVDGSWYKN
jgi:poly-beta-1,6-N-acetyl-D-glucosamine N-deacetylase